MNTLNRLVLSLVAGLVIAMCIAGAWLGFAAIDSPSTWAQLFSDPKSAGNATRLAAGGFILFQSLMGIVFAGSLTVLLSIEKLIRDRTVPLAKIGNQDARATLSSNRQPMNSVLSIALLAFLATAPFTTDAEAKGEKCSVTVVDGLAPGRTSIVVGCTGGGLTVLDGDLKQVYRWQGSSAGGGFFGSFAEVKTIKGRKALMVQMADGPRMEDGSSAALKIALHFDGKQYKFADHFED